MTFKMDDKVEIANRKGLTGKVVLVHVDMFGAFEYDVMFDDKGLIPNILTYSDSELKLIKKSPSTSPSFQSSISPWAEEYYALGSSTYTNCPNCGKKWTEMLSPFLNDVWVTCNKCNIRREDV